MKNAPKDGTASSSKPTPSTEVPIARRQSDSIEVKTHGAHMHEDRPVLRMPLEPYKYNKRLLHRVMAALVLAWLITIAIAVGLLFAARPMEIAYVYSSRGILITVMFGSLVILCVFDEKHKWRNIFGVSIFTLVILGFGVDLWFSLTDNLFVLVFSLTLTIASAVTAITISLKTNLKMQGFPKFCILLIYGIGALLMVGFILSKVYQQKVLFVLLGIACLLLLFLLLSGSSYFLFRDKNLDPTKMIVLNIAGVLYEEIVIIYIICWTISHLIDEKK